jgi:hypothetical protein
MTATAEPKEIRLSDYAPFPYAYDEVRRRRDATRCDLKLCEILKKTDD